MKWKDWILRNKWILPAFFIIGTHDAVIIIQRLYNRSMHGSGGGGIRVKYRDNTLQKKSEWYSHHVD